MISNMTRVRRFLSVVFAVFTSLGIVLGVPGAALAAAPQGNFSLQVTPSPLVTTVKPGEKKEVELKIRNASTSPEELKIEAKSFKFDDATGKVTLDETTPPEIAQWISFSAPRFTVKPGEWYTQKITINLPKESGFSYYFAMVISRTELPVATSAGQLLNGSVAVFTLINVDRPGATRSLDMTALTTSQTVYEYLPATIDIRLKNTGNTIVQPYGNVFIGRGDDVANTPIATLPVNETRAYLLPNSERTLQATWSDGFPVYDVSADASGKEQKNLVWNWDKLSKFKIGRYTVRVVAVYNDGTRDIPVMREVVFWVIPWKAILILLASITAVVLALRFYIKKRTEKAVKKALAAKERA